MQPHFYFITIRRVNKKGYMLKIIDQLPLYTTMASNLRPFFKQAGTLLLTTGAASLGLLGVSNVVHGASTTSTILDTQARPSTWQAWESLGGILISGPTVSSWAFGRL